MKSIPSALADHLNGETTTLATCWKLTRRDGMVMGFTDHDESLVHDDVMYEAATGFTPTAIASSGALNVDNLEVDGMLDAGAITESDLLAGLYDHAEIDIFEINHRSPADGRLPLKHGWLGEVAVVEGRFTAEIRGLTQNLNQRVGDLYGPTCRASLGDSRCGVAMASRTVTGQLTRVTSRNVFRDTARNDPQGRFSCGTITFTGGSNEGVTIEIKHFSGNEFTTVLPLPRLPSVGDAYRATEGCDKIFSTCVDRFHNAVNFRGEPHVPGSDRLYETAATRTSW